jgi:hypothetical protein
MRSPFYGFLFVLLLAGVSGAASGGARAARPGPQSPEVADAARVITPALILGHVEALAADDMEGRAPGTRGEERAVAYLEGQF